MDPGLWKRVSRKGSTLNPAIADRNEGFPCVFFLFFRIFHVFSFSFFSVFPLFAFFIFFVFVIVFVFFFFFSFPPRLLKHSFLSPKS